LDFSESKQIDLRKALPELEAEVNEAELRLNDALFELYSEPLATFDSQRRNWYEPNNAEWSKERKQKVTHLLDNMKEYQKQRREWTASLVRSMGEHNQKGTKRRFGFEQSKLITSLKAEQAEAGQTEEVKEDQVASVSENTGNDWGEFELGPEEVLVVDKIGSGAFGDVFRGFCRQKLVAVKTLKNINYDPSIFESLKREVMIMQYVFPS
jgi:hypothetical protein